jgi:hypothetical protein
VSWIEADAKDQGDGVVTRATLNEGVVPSRPRYRYADKRWTTTRNRTYALTAASAALYVALCLVFADGLSHGAWWDVNFQLAGSASTNPLLFGLGGLLVLAWKVAGWWGLDRWLLTRLGTPWLRGGAFVASTPRPEPWPGSVPA